MTGGFLFWIGVFVLISVFVFAAVWLDEQAEQRLDPKVRDRVRQQQARERLLLDNADNATWDRLLDAVLDDDDDTP